MKHIVRLALLFSFPFSVLAEPLTVDSSQAKQYEGKQVRVCGELIQLRDFKKGIYLNLDDNYPNSSITFVIWDSMLPKIESKLGEMPSLKNKQVCGTGTVDSYKGNLRMNINSRYNLEVLSTD